MKKPTQFKWFIDKNEIFGTISIKAIDGADTPVCIIATPINKDWMQNEQWLNAAMAKAECIVKLPNLIEKTTKLIKQIEMSDYSEPDGHHLKNMKALHDLKKLIEQLS